MASERPEHILVVGGTGRTGARLVEKLRCDPAYSVAVLARDPAKAEAVLRLGTRHDAADGTAIEVIAGDLLDLKPWAHKLDGVDQIVTAVSCGTRTDLLVLLGLRPQPQNLPYAVDFGGMRRLVEAANEHGVRRIVAVTTASTGTPWSAAAIFLNIVCYCSVKWKFFGEQAIRRSGLDYIIIRPFGLVDSPQGQGTDLGIEFSQGRTEGARRRIPREDVARLCHEALRQPAGSRLAFECWATAEHRRPLPWPQLRQEPEGGIPDVSHNAAISMAVAGVASVTGLTVASVARGVGRVLRWTRR